MAGLADSIHRDTAAVETAARALREPLTVMHVISNLDVGGAQEVVRTVCAYLAEEGCRPVVCTFQDGPLRAEIERAGIPVELLPARRHTILSPVGFLRDMWRIRRALADLVKRYEADVVQTHLLRRLDFLVLTLRRPSGLPLVFWTVHNTNFTLRAEHLAAHRWLLGPKRLGYRLLYRLGALRVNGFVAVSEEVRGAVIQDIGPVGDKVAVIPNGVDVRRYEQRAGRQRVRAELGIGDDTHLMILVGNFKEQKGHRYLIAAAAEVVPAFPHLRIAFAGDGARREELERAVQAAGLEGSIFFLGQRSDVPALLAASDSFVLPSLWEGLPMALIEAMASALPIIATDVSGTRQVMAPGVTGLLVAPGSVPELVEAMTSMLSHPEKARVMGAAAYERVSAAFSARQQARLHRDLYGREWRRLQKQRP